MVSQLQLQKLETELRTLQRLYPGLSLDGAKRLLGLPIIHSDEVFTSWLTRLILSGKITKKLLMQELGVDQISHNIDLQPEKFDFKNLLLRFNLVQVRLLEDSFIRFGKNDRLEDILCLTADVFRRKPIYRFCPFCLDTDPYIRKYWRCAFSYACVEHKCLLSEKCHACGHSISFEKLNLSFIKKLGVTDLRQCLNCGANLSIQPTVSVSEKTIQVVLNAQQNLIEQVALGKGLQEYLAEVRYIGKSDLNYLNIGLSGERVFKERADEIRTVFIKAGMFTNTYWHPSGRIYLNSGISKLKSSRLWVAKQIT